MLTEVVLNHEKKSVLVNSGNSPNRIQFETKNDELYALMTVTPENKRLETIAFRAGYELLGVSPEYAVGSHDYERHYKIKPGDVVIDAGAHVGIWTEIFSHNVGPKGQVIAFEPDFRALGYLYINNYHRENVKVIPYGLWDELDYMPFGIDPSLGTSSYFSWIDKSQNPGYQLTKVNSLDNYLKELKIDHVNLIKMDIEGAEVRALKGMVHTLKNVDALAIASYHTTMEYPKNTVEAVTKILEDANFEVKKEFSKGEVVYANRSK